MFTGLVTDVGRVKSVEDANGIRRVCVEGRYPVSSIQMGASIEHSGVCLTVVEFGPTDAGGSWWVVEAIPETLSRTTYQNLARARDVLTEHGLQRVIVVSDPLHMARALRLCRRLGIDALGSPTPSSRFRSFRTQWRFLAREVYFFHRDLVVKPD
jgi:hypothetical protein